MFHKMTRKDNAKCIRINDKKINDYNEDSDGVGTLIMMSNGSVRVVLQTPEEVDHLLRREFPIVGK